VKRDPARALCRKQKKILHLSLRKKKSKKAMRKSHKNLDFATAVIYNYLATL